MPPNHDHAFYAAPMDMCRLTPRSLQMDMSIRSKSFSGYAGKGIHAAAQFAEIANRARRR